MASLGSYIRSAARATYSAYRTVPIRWRLAGGSAALTFIILASFAALAGTVASRQVHLQFNEQQTSVFDQLYTDLNNKLTFHGLRLDCHHTSVSLGDYAAGESAQIRIFDSDLGTLLCQQANVIRGAKARLN
ncbi:MAG TPA: hypothetical protein VG365_17675, partial [Solirubrobacteraceae bacterium]|nr:hypothetical protein [Solirubrobacteraceae bacterium]